MHDPSKEFFDNYERFYDWKRQAQRTALEIKQYRLNRLPRWLGCIDNSARIVDAGCAKGYFLSLLHAAGYRDLVGVDISEQLVAHAKQSVPHATIVASDIRNFLTQSNDASFDVIFFHHVLEHIPREYTIDLLREFRRCLTRGGILNLKVPNAMSLASGYACFGDFTHVVHFNEYSLVQVVARAGFDVDKVEFISHKPELFWSWRHPVRAILRMLNRLRWHFNNGLHRAMFLVTDVHPMPHVFENEIDIIARK